MLPQSYQASEDWSPLWETRSPAQNRGWARRPEARLNARLSDGPADPASQPCRHAPQSLQAPGPRGLSAVGRTVFPDLARPISSGLGVPLLPWAFPGRSRVCPQPGMPCFLVGERGWGWAGVCACRLAGPRPPPSSRDRHVLFHGALGLPLQRGCTQPWGWGQVLQEDVGAGEAVCSRTRAA